MLEEGGILSRRSSGSSSSTSSKTNNIDKIIETLYKCVCIKESEVKFICDKAKEIFLQEPNLLKLDSPITVCGDIHGQFYDLIELFNVGGFLPDTNYLFMGDYVDRGHHSIETISLLISLKIKYPEQIFLLRGNHESRLISRGYGFFDESMRKYNNNANVYMYFMDLFDHIPIAAVIENEVFCVHGGLSPGITMATEINLIERIKEIPSEGTFSDLLWSDPDADVNGYAMSMRGAGYLFGETVVKNFLVNNNFKLILRSHQLVMEGYKSFFNGSLITVWSAPNYTYKMGNIASILEFDEHMNKTFRIFNEAPNDGNNQINKAPVLDYFL